jgi:hypothetical protein
MYSNDELRPFVKGSFFIIKREKKKQKKNNNRETIYLEEQVEVALDLPFGN